MVNFWNTHVLIKARFWNEDTSWSWVVSKIIYKRSTSRSTLGIPNATFCGWPKSLACSMAVGREKWEGEENEGGINVRSERKRSRLTLENVGRKKCGNERNEMLSVDGRERVWPSSNGPQGRRCPASFRQSDSQLEGLLVTGSLSSGLVGLRNVQGIEW